MNLVDMFLKGQGGQNIDALSRQFNLSQQQTVAALEALMPAFSQGLQRNAADPMGFGAFIQALSSGQHTNYFDNPQAAFNPSGVASGNDVLNQLFGSKDLSRAVANHAAATTGLGVETMKQMLPVIASMMMGGLYKKSTGQFAASGLGGGNVIGDLIEQMMRQGGAMMGGQPSSTQKSAPDAAPANPWGQILESMFGGAAGQQQGGQTNPLGDNPLGKIFEEMMRGGIPGAASPQAPRAGAQPAEAPQETAQGQNPFGDNPFGKIFEEMLGGGQRGAPSQAQPRQRQSPEDTDSPAPSDNPLKDVLGQMFDTGRQANEQYQKGLESIFDQYLSGMDRNRR